MKTTRLGVCIVAFCLAGAIRPAPARAASCEELSSLRLPEVRITATDARPAGPLLVARGEGRDTLNLPAFCRVEAVATPTADSEIRFEVWIPRSDSWNGRMLGVGNGGYAGTIGYRAMADGLRKGYATVGTDTGHTGSDLSFGIGHLEKIHDWGFRAVHVMTVASKPIIRAYQGRFPHHAYFSGCSTGGHQALSEAQRYPADYDGILAGAPGHNRVRLNAGFLWSWIATHREDGTSILPVSKLALLTDAVVTSCDRRDGVEDGVVDDPRRCRFDPGTLLCDGADGPGCLTAEQVEAARAVYAGARNPRTGERLFVGWAPGSEAPGSDGRGGWAGYLTEPGGPMRVGFWRDWVFGDPTWNWRSFDWDRDMDHADRVMATVAATDPDLRPFAGRGGKLLMYAGWADPVVPPLDTIDYYRAVVDEFGSRDRAGQAVRLFMAPGVGHCGGGPGPDTIDALPALVQWVEDGVPPERIVASKIMEGIVTRTRPLCPYPRVARYEGQGSTDEAGSFVCVVPEE